MERYVCIHGHFYQPPRENPWLEEVELEDSAYPYHDWNERIAVECYGPNTASRILDGDGKIVDIANNYSRMNFNFGPTLLYWMERKRPDIYGAVLEADRLSAEKFSGHGSAMAQVYNHMIMPLATRRDKTTQVLWAIEDFKFRFKRDPEGMWLPETAVDTETLEVLAGAGIKFTVLSQPQARSIRKKGKGERWLDASEGNIDPRIPYLCTLPSGKGINIFFYDGPIAHDTSFGGLLMSGEALADRLVSAFSATSGPQLVSVATDGENYGHHHRYGDMALSYCLHLIESKGLARITNYSEFLEKHPPAHEVEVIENSSWSCIHGVERWREDCGCSSGAHRGWNQGWRRPLREAFDWLRDRLSSYFEEEASSLLKDPFSARDDYIKVILDRSPSNIDAFLSEHLREGLEKTGVVKALKLLEMERSSLLMYTSCGWFFDEISGIETTQVLKYASQAIQYAEAFRGPTLEPDFLRILGGAPSNIYKNGAEVYEKFVRPSRVNLVRAGAHHAICSAFDGYREDIKIYCYRGKTTKHDLEESGKFKLLTGAARLSCTLTREEQELFFAVLHLGEQNVSCGVREFPGEEDYDKLLALLKDLFERGDITGCIRIMDRYFGPEAYTLWHLFKDEQRRVIKLILQVTYEEIEAGYRGIYDRYHSLMHFLHNLGIPLPRPLAVSSSYILNIDIKRIFSEGEVDLKLLEERIEDMKKLSLDVEKPTLEYVVGLKLTALMREFSGKPGDVSLIEKTKNILERVKRLPLEPDLWEAQNIYFRAGKKLLGTAQKKAGEGDEDSKKWVEAFSGLGSHLKVKVTQA